MALRGDRTGLFVILPGISSYAVGVCVVPCLFLSRALASPLDWPITLRLRLSYQNSMTRRSVPHALVRALLLHRQTRYQSRWFAINSSLLTCDYTYYSHSIRYLIQEVIKIIKIISFIFESFIHYVYVLLIWFSYIIKTLFGCIVNKFFFVKHSQISHSMPISVYVWQWFGCIRCCNFIAFNIDKFVLVAG